MSDALWSSRTAEGKGIPLLIVDATRRPDLSALVLAHAEGGAGDVRTWGTSQDERTVLLRMEFDQPARVNASIPFSVADQGILVDSVMHARALLPPTRQTRGQAARRSFRPAATRRGRNRGLCVSVGAHLSPAGGAALSRPWASTRFGQARRVRSDQPYSADEPTADPILNAVNARHRVQYCTDAIPIV